MLVIEFGFPGKSRKKMAKEFRLMVEEMDAPFNRQPDAVRRTPLVEDRLPLGKGPLMIRLLVESYRPRWAPPPPPR